VHCKIYLNSIAQIPQSIFWEFHRYQIFGVPVTLVCFAMVCNVNRDVPARGLQKYFIHFPKRARSHHNPTRSFGVLAVSESGSPFPSNCRVLCTKLTSYPSFLACSNSFWYVSSLSSGVLLNTYVVHMCKPKRPIVVIQR
jgi:hypothetical protein